MTNIVANFPQILAFAKQLQLPIEKKRGIIREYLQAKFIHDLYGVSQLKKLSFVGGTSLRLLRNLPRFSEDLDFDNLGLELDTLKEHFQTVLDGWRRENMVVEWIENKTDSGTYFEIRLPELLYELKITTNPKEKLRIKLDQATQWQGQKTEVVLLNRFGFIEHIVTNTLDQLLVQKLTAYVRRAEMQPRDLYDVVWLYAQGARLDEQFMTANNVTRLREDAKAKYATEQIPANFVRRLQPFLFEQTAVRKLALFGSVLEKL
jgi:predicted nucleotidyltransferase component of viral defense system